VNKINFRLKGKRFLQGSKHIIWESISVEVTKLMTHINIFNDEDKIAVLAKQRCKVINETLSKRPTEWAQNAINLLNIVPSSSLQIIGIKYRTALIIWSRRIITKHNLLNSVQNKASQLEKSVHDCDIPSELQWKEIVRLGKTKCNFPGPSK
jgi:hypothetical protein